MPGTGDGYRHCTGNGSAGPTSADAAAVSDVMIRM